MVEKDYLGSWDLVDREGAPRDYTLKIESVKSVTVKTREVPKGKRKVVIRFHGAQKAMVGNTTNCETIESMYGVDTDGWIGKSITIYQTDVKSPKGKGTIKGIRVRPAPPSKAPEQIESRPVDPEIRDAQNEAYGREPGED